MIFSPRGGFPIQKRTVSRHEPGDPRFARLQYRAVAGAGAFVRFRDAEALRKPALAGTLRGAGHRGHGDRGHGESLGAGPRPGFRHAVHPPRPDGPFFRDRADDGGRLPGRGLPPFPGRDRGPHGSDRHRGDLGHRPVVEIAPRLLRASGPYGEGALPVWPGRPFDDASVHACASRGDCSLDLEENHSAGAVGLPRGDGSFRAPSRPAP